MPFPDHRARIAANVQAEASQGFQAAGWNQRPPGHKLNPSRRGGMATVHPWDNSRGQRFDSATSARFRRGIPKQKQHGATRALVGI